MIISIEGINQEEFLDIIGKQEMPVMLEEINNFKDVKITNMSTTGPGIISDAVWSFALEFAQATAFALFCSYLYDKLKVLLARKKVKVMVDTETVNLSAKDRFIKELEQLNNERQN